MRILFVTPYIPSLVRVRPFNIVRTLAERGHEITLLTLQPSGDEVVVLTQIRSWGVKVHVVPHPRSRAVFNSVMALSESFPVQAAYSRSPNFVRQLQRVLASQQFDVAHVEHLRGAVLADSLGDLPVVFDSVDSISLLFEKMQEEPPSLKSRLMALLDLDRTRLFEATLTQRFAEVAITSKADRDALANLGNDSQRIAVVPNGVDQKYFQPQNVGRDPLQLVFTGKMSYHANVAAVEDLVRKIMPLVWDKQPQAHLKIVGKDPSSVIRVLGRSPNITVTGFVKDIRPYLAQAAIAVSTVRYGVGIQNKVLEAMAMATPVVCSRQASSALQAQNGRDLLVGDTHQEIAEHILDLLQNSDKRAAIGAAGRQYVEQHQTWEGAAALLEDLYCKAISRYQRNKPAQAGI